MIREILDIIREQGVVVLYNRTSIYIIGTFFKLQKKYTNTSSSFSFYVLIIVVSKIIEVFFLVSNKTNKNIN